MKTYAISDTKDVVILVNDVRTEYVDAFYKLQKKLNKVLRPIVLLDKNVKKAGWNVAPQNHPFEIRVCDFNSLSSLQKATKDIFKNTLLVACQSERNQPYLGKLAPFFPYNSLPTEESITWATSKSSMRSLLRSYNENLAPKFIVCETSDENIVDSVKHMRFPMIVKPNGLADSMLVTKCADIHVLLETVQRAFSVMEDIYKRDKGRGKPALVIEEFMEGDMYSIDAYIDAKGNVYTLPLIKVTTAYAAGYEGFYSYRNDILDDASLELLDVAAANDTVTQALQALKLRNSVAHVELFLTPHGWKIIELGPRIGGYRQDMYKYGLGIDHAYNEFLLKSGEQPEVMPKHFTYCNIVNVYAKEEGFITDIKGVEESKKLDSVLWLEVYATTGDEARFSTNGGKLIVDGVLTNASKEKLDKDNDALRELITISVE